MKTGSLRLRLFLAGSVSVIAALMLSALGLSLLFERHVERRIETELQDHLAQLLGGLGLDDAGRLAMANAPADPRFNQPLSGLYWQVVAGETVLRSRSLWDQKLAFPADVPSAGAVHQVHIPGPDDTDLIAVERSVVLPARLGGEKTRAIVAQNAADVVAASRAFTLDLAPYLALLALFLVGAAYAQITVGLRPLTALRNRLAKVRTGRERRMGQGFPDEVLPLAVELDALLDAREEQIARARGRASDLAHGLKTPLQVLAGEVERLKSKGETGIADEIEHLAAAMRRHVDRQLARARMAAGNADATARVADIVSQVVAVVARTPAGARLQWHTDIAQTSLARIDQDDLAEALGNLVENAARYASHAVTISAARDGGNLAIKVRDDGPGIPADEVTKVLSRGGQLDVMGDGAGLGLAIVSDVADAWGGRLEINSTRDGLSAVFIVPLAEAHRPA